MLPLCFVMSPRPANAGAARSTVSNTFPLELMDDHNLIYLVDVGVSAKQNPSQTRGFTVVFASPHAKDLDLVKDWSKARNYLPTLYMPRWTMEELQLCCRLVRPLVDDADSCRLPGLRGSPLDPRALKEHVETFGRVARPAFASNEMLQEMHKELTNAIIRCDLHHVARLARGTLEVQGQASSWLLHYEVDEQTFQVIEVQFASNYVIQQIWKQSQEDRHITLRTFLDMTASNPQYSKARGDLFEPYANWILQGGGTYPVQRFPNGHLSTPGSKQQRAPLEHHNIPLSPQSVALDTPLAIAALQPLWYGLPNKLNFPTIDAAKKPNFLFQMTVGSRHEINVDGLIEAVRGLGATVPVRLYFVVPPDQFGSYAVGTITRPTMPKDVTAAQKLQIEQQVSTEVSLVEYWVLQLYPEPPPPSYAPTSAASSAPSSTLSATPSIPSSPSASISTVSPSSTVSAMQLDVPASPIRQQPTMGRAGAKRKTP